MKIVLVINFEMPTLVGILKFITRTNVIIYCCELENCLICLHFDIYEDNKFHDHLSWAWKKFLLTQDLILVHYMVI